MKLILVLISITLISVMFGISSFVENMKMKRELKKQKKQEIRNDKIDKETLAQVEDISTGDLQHDFNAGINQLHNLSQARKN